MRFLNETSNFAKICQNPGSHNFLASDPITKQKNTIECFEKSKKLFFPVVIFFSLNCRALSNWNPNWCSKVRSVTLRTFIKLWWHENFFYSNQNIKKNWNFSSYYFWTVSLLSPLDASSFLNPPAVVNNTRLLFFAAYIICGEKLFIQWDRFFSDQNCQLFLFTNKWQQWS